jgi:hypothetical protein
MSNKYCRDLFSHGRYFSCSPAVPNWKLEHQVRTLLSGALQLWAPFIELRNGGGVHIYQGRAFQDNKEKLKITFHRFIN